MSDALAGPNTSSNVKGTKPVQTNTKQELFDALLSLADISRIIGRKKSALYVDLKEGKIAAVKVGGSTRVKKTELDRYISALPSAKFAPLAGVA
jgi:excisionase family DNA binding protein